MNASSSQTNGKLAPPPKEKKRKLPQRIFKAACCSLADGLVVVVLVWPLYLLLSWIAPKGGSSTLPANTKKEARFFPEPLLVAPPFYSTRSL